MELFGASATAHALPSDGVRVLKGREQITNVVQHRYEKEFDNVQDVFELQVWTRRYCTMTGIWLIIESAT
jgi:hypothetical protein